MKKHALTALLLAVLTCSNVLLTACSSSDGASTDTTNASVTADTTSADTTAVETEPITRENYPDNLPELNYGEETLNLRYRDSTNYRIDFVAPEQTGELVNDAVFQRNRSVEERLNLKLNLVAGPNDAKEYCNSIRTEILAGDNSYDLISAYQAYTVPLALEGCFYDVKDAPYLDFDQPWWDYDYMAELQVNDDKIFFLQGDLALFMIGSMGAVYFNKDIFNDLYGAPNDLYTMVTEGKWTMEQFGTYSAGAYSDLNGNTAVDEGDRYGFVATTIKSTEHFMYDAGVTSNQRNTDGLPTYAFSNEWTIAVIEKMYNLFYENEGAKIFTADSAIESSFVSMFTQGEVLFVPGWLYMAGRFFAGQMTDEYGIIPFPKYSEEQETYKTLVHDGTTIYCISNNCSPERFEMVCAATEAFCAESYRKVVPTYYDVALKYRYSNDEQSGQMLDIIRDNIMTDFFYANNYSFTVSPGLLCRTLMSSRSSNLSSLYRTVSKVTEKKLEELISLYQAEK